MRKKRKIFLDDLPHRKSRINWVESVGYKVRFIYYNIEGWVEIISYDPKDKYLCIKYKDDVFRVHASGFIKCEIARLLGIRTDKFKIEIGHVFKDDKRDLTIIDRKIESGYHKDGSIETRKYYKYKCGKCGFDGGEHYKNGEYKEEYWIEESSLLNQQQGCACCSRASKVAVLGINTIWDTDRWMCDLMVFEEDAKKYTKGSNKKIKVICPDCGRVKDKEIIINGIYKKKSIGCSCGDGFSYGHKYIHSILTQLNLNFQENKRFDWCKFPSYKDKNKVKTGEYDLIIEDMKLIIEVDGDFHRKDNGMSGQTKEESKYLDDMKDLKAHENGYRVVRISDENSIKDNILKSELVDIFNLNNIDWLKCEEFALSNRVKEVCKLKYDNPTLSTTEITDIVKLDRKTVIKYLKQGNALGWCIYDPKEEMKKVGIKLGTRLGTKVRKINGKQVEVFKEGISLGIFESCAELERQSEKLFGVKLNSRNISTVCNGKRSHHKGYIFKYIK